MKIVNLEQFLATAVGTLFSKYERCAFDDFCIKGETISAVDFYYQPIADAIKCNNSDEFFNILFRAEEVGESIEMVFNMESRDGCFEPKQLFAVLEPQDVVALIERLKQAL
ncbi:MAG TPA: hypothetical protein VK629_12885, partial [Steroidobacteraceae bacterium]|nr:hypothetical protein [Steroidobacteraceae bacterium]